MAPLAPSSTLKKEIGLSGDDFIHDFNLEDLAASIPQSLSGPLLARVARIFDLLKAHHYADDERREFRTHLSKLLHLALEHWVRPVAAGTDEGPGLEYTDSFRQCLDKIEVILRADSSMKGSIKLPWRPRNGGKLLECIEYMQQAITSFEPILSAKTETPAKPSDVGVNVGSADGTRPEKPLGTIIRDERMLYDVAGAVSDINGYTPALYAGDRFVPRRTLPINLANLFGYQAHIDNIVDMLCSSEHPAVAILGKPGQGKTALAAAAVTNPRVKAKYADRVHWISCEFMTELEMFTEVIGSELGIRPLDAFIQSVGYKALITSECHNTGAPRLIILDDFSNLWDTVSNRIGVEDVLTELAASSHCSLLVTSRSTRPPSTRIKWARPVLELQGLSLCDARSLYLSIHNTAIVDESLDKLLKALAGVPLAIKLVASCGRHGETPQQILRRWERISSTYEESGMDRLSLALEVALDHRVLRETTGASIVLGIVAALPDGIRNGFITEACTSVDNPEAVLKTLQDFCLVQPNLMTSRQLILLAPIRSHIRRSIPASAETMVGVFNAYFRLVDRLTRGEFSPTESASITALETENINHVLTRSLDEYPSWDAMSAISLYSPFQTMIHPKTDLIKKAIEVCNTPGRPFGHTWWSGHLQYTLAMTLYCRGQLKDAVDVLNGAIDTVKEFATDEETQPPVEEAGNHKLIILLCQEHLGQLYAMFNDFEMALSALKEAVALAVQFKDPLTLANCLNHLASVYRDVGQYGNALEADDQAIRLGQAHGKHAQIAAYWESKAKTYLAEQRINEATTSLENSVESYRKAGVPGKIAGALMHKAKLHEQLGDHKSAISDADEIIALFRRLGDANRLFSALQWLGKQYSSLGQPFDALRMHREALEVARGLDSALLVAHCSEAIMTICFTSGDMDAAIEAGQAAAAAFGRANEHRSKAKAHITMATAYLRLRRLSQAEALVKSAIRTFASLVGRESTYDHANATQMLGTIQLDLRRYHEAHSTFTQAALLFSECGTDAEASRSTCIKLAVTADLRARHYDALSKPGIDAKMKIYHERLLQVPDPMKATAFIMFDGPDGPVVQSVDFNNQTEPIQTVHVTADQPLASQAANPPKNQLRPGKGSEMCAPNPISNIHRSPTLIGRTKDVHFVAQLLLLSSNTHVALCGEKGMGKTVVAQAVIAEPSVVERFRHRIHWISCEAIHHPASLPAILKEKVLQAAAPKAHRPPKPGMPHLNDTGTRMPHLVVMDNLIGDDEAIIAAVGEINSTLAQSHNICLLITLKGSGAPAKMLGCLEVPLSPIAEADALKLYREVNRGCVPQDHEHRLVELVKELGCNPFAICLLAGHHRAKASGEGVPCLPAAQLPDERTNPITRLLAPAFRRVIDQLHTDDVKALGIIALLPHGVRYDTLAELLPPNSNVDALLEILSDLCVLHQGEGPDYVVFPSPVRSYLTKQFPASREDRHRLFRSYFELLSRLNAGEQSEAETKRILSLEESNITYILVRATEELASRDALQAVATYPCIPSLSVPRAHVLESALDTLYGFALKEPYWTVVIQLRLGKIYKESKRPHDALHALSGALKKLQKSAQPEDQTELSMRTDRLLIECSLLLARVHEELGDFQTAASLMDDILQYAERREQPEVIAECNQVKAVAYRGMKKYQESLDCDNIAISIFERVEGPPLELASALCSQADTYAAQGRWNDAIGALDNAIKIYDGPVYTTQVAQCLGTKANFLAELKDLPAGIKALEESLKILRNNDDIIGVITRLLRLCTFHCLLNQKAETFAFAAEALAVALSIEHVEYTARGHQCMFVAHLIHDQYPEAIEHGNYALRASIDADNWEAVQESTGLVVGLHRKLEPSEEALKLALTTVEILAGHDTLLEAHAEMVEKVDFIQAQMQAQKGICNLDLTVGDTSLTIEKEHAGTVDMNLGKALLTTRPSLLFECALETRDGR